MKKYYLHNGTESSGPFNIEELKAKKITKASPVWFEGMQHWKTAGDIPELNHLFMVNPPAFSPFLIPEPEPNIATQKTNRKILGLSKKTFFIGFGVIVILIGITVLNTIEENKSRELEQKNHKTEIENFKLEQKQKALEDEKVQAAIQEQIEAERKIRDQKQTATNRISEIEQLLVQNQKNLDETEKKLKSTSGFKLLRTQAEKKEQLDLLQKNIDSIKTVISTLKEESGQLKLELEKLN